MINLLITGLGRGCGGISSVIINVLKTIDRDKFFITVLDACNSIAHKEIEDMGYKVVSVPPFKKYFQYKKAIKQLLLENSFDIVWINNTSKVDRVIIDEAYERGIKIVTHSHGASQEGDFVKRTIYQIMNVVNENNFYRKITMGIACSKSSSDYFYNKKKMGLKPVLVLPNAIELEKYKYNEEIRNKYRKELRLESKVVLSCVGRITRVKNIGFAVKLLTKLPKEYVLLLIGQESSNEVRTIVSELGLMDRVIFLGRRDDVAQIINAVDVLLMPSFSEGLPMAALEAQANGIPCVISSRVSDECKGLDSTIFVDLEDFSSWISAIKAAKRDNNFDSISIMREKGFALESYTKKLESIFIDVINK